MMEEEIERTREEIKGIEEACEKVEQVLEKVVQGGVDLDDGRLGNNLEEGVGKEGDDDVKMEDIVQEGGRMEETRVEETGEGKWFDNEKLLELWNSDVA